MRNIILTIVLICGIQSCKTNDLDCQPEMVDSEWVIDKVILIEYNSELDRNEFSVTEGENWLFTYTHTGPQCDEIIDDEWAEVLTFEIDKDITHFEYSDEITLQEKCFYKEYGAWARNLEYEIENGIIEGERISENEWEIKVSVNIKPLVEDVESTLIEFHEIFTN